MPNISIASITLPNWQGNASGISLYIYVNEAFTAESGTVYPATVKANLPHNGLTSLGTFYLSFPCTVSGTSLTIPTITLDSTTDSPDNPNATFSAVLWDGTSGQPIQNFGTLCQFPVPATPTSTTWEALFPPTSTVAGAYVTVGTVTELSTGAFPTASISGSKPYLLNLGIPPGPQGIQGEQGLQGIQGQQGAPGDLSTQTMTARVNDQFGDTNLFNPTAWVDGCVQISNGALVYTGQGYLSSAQFPVLGGASYFANFATFGGGLGWAWYDQAGTFISGTAGVAADTAVVAPSKAAYGQTCFNAGAGDTPGKNAFAATVMIFKDALPAAFVPYGMNAIQAAAITTVAADVQTTSNGILTAIGNGQSGKNLFNPGTWVDGFVGATGAIGYTGQGFLTSAFISAYSGASYVSNSEGQFVWYDVNGNVLSQSGDVQAGATATAPANTATLRFGFKPANLPDTSTASKAAFALNAMICNGALPTTFIPYGTTQVGSAAAIGTTVAQIDSQFGNTNLFNPTAWVDGFMDQTSGAVNYGGQGYMTSAAMPAIAGVSYYANVSAAFVWFNYLGVAIAGVATGNLTPGTAALAPEGAVTFHIATSAASSVVAQKQQFANTIMVFKSIPAPVRFAPYGASPVLGDALLPLAGLKWVPVGDSITAGGTYQSTVLSLTGLSIPYQDARGGRQTQAIFENYNYDPVNGVSQGGIINNPPEGVSISEGVLTNNPGPWSTGHTLAQDLANVDLVTIFLGTNDAGLWLTNPGTINDAIEPPASYASASFYSAWKNAITGYLNAKPGIRLLIITPYLQAYDETPSPGSVAGMTAAIQSLAALYSIPVLPLVQMSGINSTNWSAYLDSDNTHPNPTAGGPYLGRLFARYIINNF